MQFCPTILRSQIVPWFLFLLFVAPEPALSQTVREYQQQASELTRSYRFSDAVELLQAGLRQHPGNLELARQLGVLLVRTGNATEGERLLREALARQPHQLELLDALAEAELRQGRPGAAVSLLEDVSWHQPEDAQVQYRLAQALFLSGEFQRALEPARRSVELNPRDSVLRRFYSLLLDIRWEEGRVLPPTEGGPPTRSAKRFDFVSTGRKGAPGWKASGRCRVAPESKPAGPREPSLSLRTVAGARRVGAKALRCSRRRESPRADRSL